MSDRPVVYTGPDIPDVGLHKLQVFWKGLPPGLKGAKITTDIEKLTVPLYGLLTRIREMRKSGTNEARLFREVQKAGGVIR